MDFLSGLVDSVLLGGSAVDPTDAEARGTYWFVTCGAESKMRASGSSYHEYLAAEEVSTECAYTISTYMWGARATHSFKAIWSRLIWML